MSIDTVIHAQIFLSIRNHCLDFIEPFKFVNAVPTFQTIFSGHGITEEHLIDLGVFLELDSFVVVSELIK